MSDDYLPGTHPILPYLCRHEANVTAGAMVLGHSLRDNGTEKQLVALITLDTLQTTSIDELRVSNPATHNIYR